MSGGFGTSLTYGCAACQPPNWHVLFRGHSAVVPRVLQDEAERVKLAQFLSKLVDFADKQQLKDEGKSEARVLLMWQMACAEPPRITVGRNR